MKLFLKETVSKEEAVPGAVIIIQSFGDLLGFNSHLHVLASPNCFYGQGMFRVVPRFETRQLEEIFRHKVLKMPLSKGKTTEELKDMLMTWRHSGFNVFCCHIIQPGAQEVMENLVRYIIRAFLSRLCPIDRRDFSQDKMTCIPEESKVIYRSKDGKEEKVFDALEWPRRQAGCKHSLSRVPMSRIRESRLCVTMAIIVMSVAVNGKTGSGQHDTLQARTGRIIQRAQKKLSKTNPEDLRSTDALHSDTAGAVKTVQIIHLFHPQSGQHFIFLMPYRS